MASSSSFLAATRLMKNQTRGKALANWARPSIDEMGVPTESWKQVRNISSLNVISSQTLPCLAGL